MPTASKSKLVNMLKLGMLEELAKELFRYAKIEDDKRFVMKEGRYAGNNRVVTFLQYGQRWEVDMLNGAVIGAGYDPA